jgi:hypothetical protein
MRIASHRIKLRKVHRNGAEFPKVDWMPDVEQREKDFPCHFPMPQLQASS